MHACLASRLALELDDQRHWPQPTLEIGGPFHHDDRALAAAFAQTERWDPRGLVTQSIEIDVQHVRARGGVFVHERKRRTGDGFSAGYTHRTEQRAREEGLAGAERSVQQEEITRLEPRREGTRELDGATSSGQRDEEHSVLSPNQASAGAFGRSSGKNHNATADGGPFGSLSSSSSSSFQNGRKRLRVAD